MTKKKAQGIRRRGIKRWIANPVASVALLVLLLADAATLPTHVFAGGVSTVGYGVERLLCRPRRSIHPIFYDSLVVKEESGVRVLQPNIESWDEATKLIASRPADLAILSYTPRVYKRGFWAITREDFKHEIEFVEGGSALTKVDRQAARGAMLDALFGETARRSELLLRLREEDLEGSRVLWPGVAHNVAAGAALVAFVFSLGWIPVAIGAWRRRRAAAALSRGACPKCGYSINGLAVCPECGTVLKLNDPGAKPGS